MFWAFKKVEIGLADEDEMRAARLAMRTKQHNRDWAPLPDLTTSSMVTDSTLVKLVIWSSFELYISLLLRALFVASSNTIKHARQQVTSKLRIVNPTH